MPKEIIETSIAAVQTVVRSYSAIAIVGNRTKHVPLSQMRDDAIELNLSQLTGILEYDPSEFTITARCGTKLDQLQSALAEHQQFMPFDPPLVRSGATLGGAIAAGIAGPCRLRFGGVRDFVLGVRFVDGTGTLATAGGKVVKNAAGFDIPKMMVGSWGELGAMVEATIKVFPRPAEYLSLRIETDGMKHAIEMIHRLTRSSIECDAIDFESNELLVRLGGTRQAIEASARRAAELFEIRTAEIILGEEERLLWEPLHDWSWCPKGHSLIRVPVTTRQMIPLDLALSEFAVQRRYSVAGNIVWIAWPSGMAFENLSRVLSKLQLVGRIVRGECPVESTRLGYSPFNPFASRVYQALDPHRRFSMPTPALEHE